MKIVTLLTDFGISDPYVAETKGAILSRCRDATIIDITHQVEPYNIRQGAFLLLLAHKFFPSNTIHVAVVDPGVGTERRGLALKTRNYWFIGPDNGILYAAATSDGLDQCFTINLERYPRVGGHTFHARDVFGPVAGELAAGLEPALSRISSESIVRLEIATGKFEKGEAKVEVMHVDRFGNAILNIGERDIPQNLRLGDEVVIDLGDRKHHARFVKAYGDLPAGSLLLTFGGTGLLEIAVCGGDASSLLGLRPGQKVRLKISASS